MSSAAYIDILQTLSDILCIQEHHLYYEHSSFLTTLNSDFTGLVIVCDENNALSNIRLRKGGLAILWHKSLDYCISRVTLPVQSDRFMAIRIEPHDSKPIFVINVYMPSTNMTVDAYRECISELTIILEWASALGTCVTCGDFNGQLVSTRGSRAGANANVRGAILNELLSDNNMYSTVAHESCIGPWYTWLASDTSVMPSQLDHFIMYEESEGLCKQCYVHEDNCLNTSDHYPVTLVLMCDVIRRNPGKPPHGIIGLNVIPVCIHSILATVLEIWILYY